MEVTKTVRCKLIGLTRRESCSGDNFKKAKKMRFNEDLIDREETLSYRKCVSLKVALSHQPFNEGSM